MALAEDLVGLGMPNDLATVLGQSTLTAVTAAGTTQGTATALSASNSIITAAASQTGVKLPSTASRTRLFFIQNSPASTASAVVYPPTGIQFSGLAANIGITVPAGGFVLVDAQSSTYWGALTSFGSPSGQSAASGQSASPRTIAIGGLVPAVSTDFNNSTPVITEVYLGEVLVPCNMTVTGIAVFNGSDVTGNMKLGLYDSTGALVAQTASTAGSGPDAYQRVAFTAAYSAVGPATYYIAGSYSSATARYNSPPLGNFGAATVTTQVYGTLPLTVTPPTTFTTNVANIASLY